MRLYLVRHAWAGQRDESKHPDDRLRPLTEKGKKRFRRQMELLVERGFDVVHVATSPLVRCRQTAEILAAQSPHRPDVTDMEALAPGAELAPLIAWTHQQSEGDVAWVAHAPDVNELAAALIGTGSASVDFAKGAVAAIEFQGAARSGLGTLRWLVTAEVLGC